MSEFATPVRKPTKEQIPNGFWVIFGSKSEP